MRNLILLGLSLLMLQCSTVSPSAAADSKSDKAAAKSTDNRGQGAITQIDASTKLAYEGGTLPLTTTPVVGTPLQKYASALVAGTEPLGSDEVRVTILGSGDPFVKASQSSASVLVEVGNEQHDIFFFDLGSGA